MPKEKEKIDDLEAVRIIAEVLVSFDDTERERIVRWALEKLGGRTVTPQLSHIAPIETEVSKVALLKQFRDIKSFINEKDPQNDKQLAAVVAYYYVFEALEKDRKTSIAFTDIIEACRLSGRRRPTNPGQTLINAAHSGFLDKAENAGSYKLNAVGENLVAMALPGGAKPSKPKKKAPSKSKSKSKKPTKKKA